MMNPFYITGDIPDKYFCDREKETEWLLNKVKNRAHILLTSPRRMGKTQLIYHLYETPEVKNQYYTFYTDIFPTTSLHEMVLLLSKEIYRVLVPRGKAALDRFLASLHSLKGSFGYDPVTGAPSFDVKLGDIHSPALTLEEIFNYLENADRPCIFAIDEFQQITHFPEKNVEALLRSYVQHTNNCLFIYAGSNRHILENMFHSPAKPFYNSTEQLYLDRIPREKYIAFAQRMFSEGGITLSIEAATYAYDTFEGHTYYVHNLFHNTFSFAQGKKIISVDDMKSVLLNLLEEKRHSFSSLMNQLNYQQKEIIIALAKDGKATGLTSAAFIKKHALKSPSSVQFAISTLLDKQIVTYENEGRSKWFMISDRFLSEWIRNTY